MAKDTDYCDRHMPTGRRPPSASDHSDPTRSHSPNSRDQSKEDSGTGTVRDIPDQGANG